MFNHKITRHSWNALEKQALGNEDFPPPNDDASYEMVKVVCRGDAAYVFWKKRVTKKRSNLKAVIRQQG